MDHSRFLVRPGERVQLKNFDPDFTGGLDKDKALKKLEKNVCILGELQNIMYAQNQWAVLGLCQGFHGAGKDTVFQDVLSCVKNVGCTVTPFGQPSKEELDHDYLWRCVKALPQRGQIGMFIRSYYEEVLVVRMYPEVLNTQRLPERLKDKNIWRRRFREINNFEEYLVSNGIVVLKFFLYLSSKKQAERMLNRIDDPNHNWKFSINDVRERQEEWGSYHRAVEAMLTHTSTKIAPWYIIPADHKWFAKLAVASIWVNRLKKLGLCYPELNGQQKRDLKEGRKLLLAERKSHRTK